MRLCGGAILLRYFVPARIAAMDVVAHTRAMFRSRAIP